MSGTVVDASALLAYVLGEAGALAVKEAAESGDVLLSAVNYAEILAILSDHGISPERLAEDFAEKNVLDLVEIVDFTPDLAELAAQLRVTVKDLKLSLGDRACLALGKMTGFPVFTADRAWLQVPGITVKVIR